MLFMVACDMGFITSNVSGEVQAILGGMVCGTACRLERGVEILLRLLLRLVLVSVSLNGVWVWTVDNIVLLW